jgi:pimeloyl-ACP methyl ester carboxylesterase
MKQMTKFNMKNNNTVHDTTLIFLHGWGGSQLSLQPLASILKDLGYPTHVLEMPGHGKTEEMNKPWNMNDFAQWANTKIKELGINNYILIGHSFGGKIMLEGLHSHILQPEKIILINTNGIKPKNSIKKTFWKIVSSVISPFKNVSFLSPIKRLIYRYIIRETDYLKTDLKINVRESFKLFNEEHYDEIVSHITIPTLLIWGSKDTQTPLWMGEFLHNHIKNSKLVIVPEATHGLPLKQPQTVADLIDNYLHHD